MRFIQKLLPASKWKLVLSTIGILSLVAFTSIVLFETTKAEVVITDNGKERTVTTHKNTVEELLEEVDITVSEHDSLSHDLNAEIESGMEINYDTANQITLAIDGNENTYYSTKDTVEEFFKEQNLSFSKHDDISLKGSDKIKDGLQIEVKKAFEVAINDGGKDKVKNFTGGTVEDLLNQYQIEIDDDDKIKPALDEQVTKDTSINIVRVDVKEEALEEKVAFKTETKQDSSLLKGKQKTIKDGKDGKVLKTYEVTLENGEEIERKLVDEKVQTESVNKVVAVGTKEPEAKLTTLSSSNSNTTSSSDSKTLTMTASAFTSSCSGCSGYTATGINLKDNPSKKVIAVDPSVISLGTRVWVEGYGEAVAGDTGGNIKGSRIDVHVPNKSEAYQWGVRKVKVKILD
ncbi:G5 and 3D domain-containing protein [Oceanobacillus halophilus]|uniref:DUF348 domain-containing protein n=1 Tax=Oceanobacillus halophilus TaxID=930130 RepID=A0A495A171_9BACI|nr:G5 and 3D domain-containing protein [Oceanobacillus halophilus]RKQ33018.1 DUF348 domain-containing protein [Oceanobacillus halophilus]